MVKQKKQKKTKLAFWKKLGPEGKRVADHVGKILDNSRIQEATDGIINLALAYYGVKAFGHIGGAIIGPISLKLATARNEVAGAAGVAGLACLGLASTGRVQDIVEALINPEIVLVDGQRFGADEVVAPSFSPDFPYELTCPDGYRLVRGPSAAFCVPNPV
ncbi:hypothetical protein ES705_23192 [subsurface metagenome]